MGAVHSRAQLKPTSLDIDPVGLTAVSCPSLLRPRDGTVGQNKGAVFHLSLRPHPEITTGRNYFPLATFGTLPQRKKGKEKKVQRQEKSENAKS